MPHEPAHEEWWRLYESLLGWHPLDVKAVTAEASRRERARIVKMIEEMKKETMQEKVERIHGTSFVMYTLDKEEDRIEEARLISWNAALESLKERIEKE